MKCPNPPYRFDDARYSDYYTRDGWLKVHALNLGYTHEHDTAFSNSKTGTRTDLWVEGNAIHVRQHDHIAKTRIFWVTFIPSEGPGAYTAARDCYASAVHRAIAQVSAGEVRA